MELSRTERWLLSNQYRILEFLDKANAEGHRNAQTILECGYELQYDELCQHVYDGRDILSEAEGRYVLEVMTMFEYIQIGFDALDDKSGIETTFIDFPGFDGNTETIYLGYARHYCSDGKSYDYLRKTGNDFNSHMPTRDIYTRMLAAYRASSDPLHLSKDDLICIQQAIRNA